MSAAKEPPVKVSEMSIVVPDIGFDDIVEILRKVWNVAELPGVRGCSPCRSGLDRFVIESPAFRKVAE